MRSSLSAAVRVMVLCYACVVLAGCGGPETGTQVKVTEAETQKRTQGIKDAMKAGMYNKPTSKPASAK